MTIPDENYKAHPEGMMKILVPAQISGEQSTKKEMVMEKSKPLIMKVETLDKSYPGLSPEYAFSSYCP